jgi:hypothetical protein
MLFEGSNVGLIELGKKQVAWSFDGIIVGLILGYSALTS